MTTAKLSLFGQHRDYEGSTEEAQGLPPTEDQLVRAAELNAIAEAIDDHAPRIDQAAQAVLDIIDSTTGESLATLRAALIALEDELRGASAPTETMTALRSDIDDVTAILASDDPTLDTAQERVDRIKQLMADVNSFVIADIQGLQSALDGKENIGVAASLDTALESTIRGTGAAGETLTSLVGDIATLQGLINTINTVLSANDTDFDTAQERLDELKRLANLIGGLTIASVAGLQPALDAIAAQQAAQDESIACQKMHIDAMRRKTTFDIEVDATIAGASGIGSFTIPTSNSNYLIEWYEKGNVGNNSGGQVPVTSALHTVVFPSAGKYILKIDPVSGENCTVSDFDRFQFNNIGDKDKFLKVLQWGSTRWATMRGFASGAENLTTVSNIDAPDLSLVTNMAYMFFRAYAFNSDLSQWVVSNVKDMSFMFFQAYAFNSDLDLSGWSFESMLSATGFLLGTAFTTTNYDLLLASLATQNLMSGVTFHAGNTQYSASAAADWAAVTSKGWTLIDSGQAI